jgi:hypothetical protein
MAILDQEQRIVEFAFQAVKRTASGIVTGSRPPAELQERADLVRAGSLLRQLAEDTEVSK